MTVINTLRNDTKRYNYCMNRRPGIIYTGNNVRKKNVRVAAL